MRSENSSVPHVSIIILNWNGWQDTVECLETVLKSNYANYSILLIDNNSSNNSVRKIKQWLNGELKEEVNTLYPQLVFPPNKKPIYYNEVVLKNNELTISKKNEKSKIFFILSDKNLGFAVANNRAIQFAHEYLKSEYYFLLNNDTVIGKETISELINCLEKHVEFGIASSVIYKYGKNKKIASAGGKITFWAQSKYYKTLPRAIFREITFANGCALMIREGIVSTFGPLSEKFFFGEEDFELSWRMNKNKIKMVCVTKSAVYHKISATSDNYFSKEIKKVFLFGMNRFVNMKHWFSKPVWKIWKFLSLGYFFYLMTFLYRAKINKAFRLVLKLNYYSNIEEDVKKETINRIFKEIGL